MNDDHHLNHKTMLNLLNDLSPFKYAYLYGFVIIFCVPLLFGSYFTEYHGFTPFAQSMQLASGKIRLLSDAVMIYAWLSVIGVLLAFLLKDLSAKTNREFRLATKNAHKNLQTNNYQHNIGNVLLYIPLCFIACVFCWLYFFTFSDAGSAKIMTNILSKSEIVVIGYILFGYLGNLYIFILNLMFLEVRKYVV